MPRCLIAQALSIDPLIKTRGIIQRSPKRSKALTAFISQSFRVNGDEPQRCFI
jgi:hypothetical protein